MILFFFIRWSVVRYYRLLQTIAKIKDGCVLLLLLILFVCWLVLGGQLFWFQSSVLGAGIA